MPCASSNSWQPVLAVLAKQYAMNWLSAFLVRIAFTARRSILRRPTACRVVPRVDRHQPSPVVWWILLWARILPGLRVSLRAIAEYTGFGHRTIRYRLRA